MMYHYLVTAWRNFLRFKLIAVINVVGLALGLACSIAAIGTHSYFESADKHVPGSERAVMILQRYSDTVNNLNGPLMSQVSEGIRTSMRKEFPEIPVAFVNGIGSLPVDVDGRREFVNAAVGDAEYMDILDLPRIQLQSGNPLKTPLSAVLTEEAAQKLFGATQPIGRTLRLQGVLDVTVVAILKSSSMPSHGLGRNASFKVPGLLISRETSRALFTARTGKPFQESPLEVQWSSITFGSAVYAQLPADGSLSASELEARLQGLPERNGAPDTVKTEIRVATLPQAWIQEMNVNLFKGSTKLSVVGLIIALGVASLGVALANYLNLSFAQARARFKETGLRRAIGASRTQLATQIGIEISLYLLVSAALAFIIALAVGQALETYVGLPIMGNILRGSPFWLRTGMALLFVLTLLAACRIIGVLSVQPSHALRDGGASRGNGFGAYSLLCAQFVATSILVVVLLVVTAQHLHARNLAKQTSSDVLVTLGLSYRLGGSKFDVWRTELLRSPAVKGVTSSTSPPWASGLGMHPMRTKSDQILNPNSVSVGYDFEKVMDHRLVAGRTFSASLRDAEASGGGEPPAIVDETLARALGYKNPTEAIGQSIRGAGFMAGVPPLRIVGVVADKPMRLQPLLDFVGTLYVPETGAINSPVVRIDKNKIAEGLAAIDAVWAKLAPREKLDREFSDEAFARAYSIYTLIEKVLTGVAGVALFIAMLGGFSFALFATQQRSQEIAVRKTLGANATSVFVMLLRDYSRPILIANVLGWPIAYVAIRRYLSTFEQPVELSIWYFAASLVVTLAIAWIAVARQALRAALLNPATVLRHE